VAGGIDLTLGIKWYLVFLFSTVCHEAAHAWAAWKLGDDTAHRGGQVTLDPSPHLFREPVGMIVVPLLSYVSAGWMVGWASAPYNLAWARQYPARSAWMALAGPAANIALLLLSALLIWVGTEWNVLQPPTSPGFAVVTTAQSPGWGEFGATMLSLCFSLNLLLAVFNLLPVPPLDGAQLPLLFLRGDAAETYRNATSSPAWAWIGLFVAWRVSNHWFPGIFASITSLLLPSPT